MICQNCRTGAQILNGIKDLPPDKPAVIRGARRRGANAHGKCAGGAQGCPCQHRGTRYERHPAGDTRPAARITARESGATR